MQKSFWQSKKWWAGFVGVVIPIANKAFGWNLDTGDVLTMILPIVAYLVGQGFADGGG